jgi:hypothetical protein
MKEKLRDLKPSKVFYLWERYGFKRIELFTQEDLAKKPEIPQSKFAAAHQRILDGRARRKKKHHG